MRNDMNVVALAGGVGGAKLATGLQEALLSEHLTVIVNTGDDFEHWGLTICPDLDTVLYNLANVHNPEMGWGRADETFMTLQTMGELGGEDWFRLGDRDLALHMRRTEWLRQGHTLSEVAEALRVQLSIQAKIVPMSDAPIRTLVHTDEGTLPFQHYFVRRRCEPTLKSLHFQGAEQANMTAEAQAALDDADLIIFCPSNPYLSLDPILSVPGMGQALLACTAPIVAVSPIVGGQAIKGPAAKIMAELGVTVSPLTVAQHFETLLDGFIMDNADSALSDQIPLPTMVTNTMMYDLNDKATLAGETIRFGLSLSKRGVDKPN